MKYSLTPKTPDLNIGDAINRWQHDAAQGGRRHALGEFALEFQTIPTLLAVDILDGRVALDHQPTLDAGVDETIVFWDGPVGEPLEYLHDWKTLAFNINGPKLDWIQAMLTNEDMMKARIHIRMMPQERRPDCPRLEVPIESYREAVKVNLFRINGQLVRDLPNDSALFMPDGDGWALDNVDRADDKHIDPEIVEREIKEKTPELPEAE